MPKATNKKRLGRPPIGDRRENHIGLMLNNQEIGEVKEYMKENEIDEMSPFIRRLLMSKIRES